MNLKECDPQLYEELQDLISQIIEYFKDHDIISHPSGDNGIDVVGGYRVLVNPENRRIYAYRYTGAMGGYHNYPLADPDCFDKIVSIIKLWRFY